MAKTQKPPAVEERTVEDRIEELRRRREAARTPGGEGAAEKQHDKGKLTAHERLDILMDAGSFVETDPFAVHRAHDFGMADKRPPGDGIDHRVRHDRRAQGVRRLAGLHRVRRFDGRGARTEGLQGDGPRTADRRALHPDQRLRRRADPGGRRVARRLRLHLRAQRARLGRDPADQRDHGPLRRRRRLLPRDHRLHLHGEGDLPHVHHRPRRDQDGDRRGRDDGGARRRDDPRDAVRRRLVRRRGRRGRPDAGALPAVVPAVEQPRGPAGVRHRPTIPSA